jgi:hypothetical protein
MIDLPELADWTLDTVHLLVAEGVFEAERFDLKETLPHPKNWDTKDRLLKAIAAFANSYGGFFVFGIKDDKNLSSADRVVGMPVAYDLPEHFGNYPAKCQPAVEWRPKNPAIRLTNGKVLHVVHVSPSPRRPHAVEADGGSFVFPKRTNKGNEVMSYEEIRTAFQISEFRRSKIAVLIAELDHINALANSVKSDLQQKEHVIQQGHVLQAAWAMRYPTMLLDTCLADVHALIENDGDLWGDLRVVRTAAGYHNAICEGFSNIAYLKTNNQPRQDRQHYDQVEARADVLIKHTICAIDGLRTHL